MATPVVMVHHTWPGTRTAYEGYSWTTFFWGPFPSLFRGDWIGLVIGLGVGFLSTFLAWIPFVVWAAFYNRNHYERLTSAGWTPAAAALPYGAGYPFHPSYGHAYAPALPYAPAPSPPQPYLPAGQPAAGWYPDPYGTGRLRYWTGSSWSEAVG